MWTTNTVRLKNSITMNLKLTLRVTAIIGIFLGLAFFARSLWREHAYRMTTSGAWGCGFGNVTVVSEGVKVEVRTGLDTIRLIGREVDADELVRRFDRRIVEISPGPEIWREHRITRDEYELILAAKLLIEIDHPRALDIFVALLDDPLFVTRADDWIVELGDVQACPALLESWKKRPNYPYVYVNAFRELPYSPAIPHIIEVFRPRIGDYDAEHLFQTLETISGESLNEFRGRRLNTPAAVDKLKQDLNKWWIQRPNPESEPNKPAMAIRKTLRVD